MHCKLTLSAALFLTKGCLSPYPSVCLVIPTNMIVVGGSGIQFCNCRPYPLDSLTLHKSASECGSNFVINARLPIGVKGSIRGMQFLVRKVMRPWIIYQVALHQATAFFSAGGCTAGYGGTGTGMAEIPARKFPKNHGQGPQRGF